VAFERTGPAAWATHPGEILQKDFLKPLGITAYRLAKAIGVPQTAISEITRGKRGISADVAVRLARFFGTTEELWMHLQSQHELAMARKRSKSVLAKIQRYDAA
jgi:addiction module HigA family antidote